MCVFRPDPYGKYASYRVYLFKGELVKEELLTDNRALSYAMKACHEELDMLSSGLSRHRYEFTVPAPVKLKIGAY